METPSPEVKLMIYGEGACHPAFQGSIYMRDIGESQACADSRFSKAMTGLGFEWLGEGK